MDEGLHDKINCISKTLFHLICHSLLVGKYVIWGTKVMSMAFCKSTRDGADRAW